MGAFYVCPINFEQKDERSTEWKPAGFWLRLFAYSIDLLFVVMPTILLILPVYGTVLGGAAVVAPAMVADPGFIMGSSILFFVGLPCLVLALFEGSYLRGTPGKLLMGLCVVDGEGGPVSIIRSFSRNCLKIVSGVVLMLGYIMAGLTSSKQALHDILSDCLVMKDPNVSAERRLLVAFLSVVIAWSLMMANLFIGRNLVDQIRQRARYSFDQAQFRAPPNLSMH